MKDLWRNPFHVVLEVENRNCAIIKKYRSLGLKHLKVVDVRGSFRNSVKHLVELDPDDLKRINKTAVELKSLLSSSKSSGKTSVWLESEGCEVCNNILSYDAFLVSGKSDDGFTIMYSFMVPSFEAYQKIISNMEKVGLKVTVFKMRKFEPQRGFLTAKQERIFWIALKSGFFDYPRKIKLAELASKLGISSSTLSEITRRGMRRMLEHHFKNRS